MFTISENTKNDLEKIFNENERIQRKLNLIPTCRDKEKEFIKYKEKDNLLKISSDLIFTTFAGIEEQCKRCEISEIESDIFFGYYQEFLELDSVTMGIELPSKLGKFIIIKSI
jgi:hypothetical protein